MAKKNKKKNRPAQVDSELAQVDSELAQESPSREEIEVRANPEEPAVEVQQVADSADQADAAPSEVTEVSAAEETVTEETAGEPVVEEAAEAPVVEENVEEAVADETPAEDESAPETDAEPVAEEVAEQPAVPEEKKEKSSKKKGFGVNYRGYMNSLQHNGFALLFSAIGVFVIMAAAFVAIFFLVLQSPEQVMVPNVVGEPLEEALLAMQVKELYPKIQLRYSNSAEDKGDVLEQDPPAGTIVKAGRRINLTVSRGIVVDQIGSYVGLKVDDLRISLQAAFSGMAVQLINVPETVMYRTDDSEPGTILEQDPPPETSITTPVTLSLIVSSGPGNETAKVPWLVGMSLNDALLQMSRTKIIFNWTARPLKENETPGIVVSQKVPGSDGQAPAYSVSECVIAMPEEIENDLVYGIFTTELAALPYPLKIQLDVIPPEGDPYTLVTFRHLGGKVTIPYAVPQFSELVFSVEDKEQSRQVIR